MDLDYSYLLRAHWGKGCFIEDYLLLASVVAMFKPRTLLEVGTSTGLGAVVLAHEASRWREDVYLVTVDVDQSHGRDNVSLFPGIAERIEFVQGWSDEVLARYVAEGRRFDLAFVDGNHAYAQARRDWEHARQLAPALVLHDTTQYTGLQRLVGEIRAGGGYDVFQFVAAPGHRVKPAMRQEGFITGMTLVQDRAALACLAGQAHRDDEGRLLPGHKD